MNTFTKYPYSNKLKNNLNKSLLILYMKIVHQARVTPNTIEYTLQLKHNI